MSEYPTRKITSGTDSPPPPTLKIQCPVRTGLSSSNHSTAPPARSTQPMAAQRRKNSAQKGMVSTSSSNASNSSSPIHNPHSHQSLGHHSPDITLGSQLLSHRRWSNSDSDDDEELMDINEAYVPDVTYSSKVVKPKIIRLEPPVDKDIPPPVSEDDEDEDEEGKFTWTTRRRGKYYQLLVRHNFNPVGPQKRFIMAAIHEEMCKFTKKQMDIKWLWDHLNSLYNMKAMRKYYEKSTPIEEFTLEPTIRKQTVEPFRKKAAKE